ncbi:TolC family protein [Anthocerotibacter panamensis]|uniref:TolC family protein n=1 Tax=Anthocerotibacter panamensis TaxID=2857077 RepID=UPI001C402529|nr:TolC family protein [Anthocerotibacter panamensis]
MNLRFVSRFLLLSIWFIPAPLTAQSLADANTTAAALATKPLEPTIPPMPKSAFEVKVQANRPLKLQEAIDIALARSPQIALARLAIDRSEAGIRQAQAALFPTVALTTSYSYNQSAQSKITNDLSVLNGNIGGTTLTSVFSQVETAPLNGQVNINWNVYSGGLFPARVRAAEASLRSTQLDFERIRQDLVNSVITAYYDLQAADGNLAIGESAVRSAESSLQDAETQNAAGTGTRFAVLQAEVQKANAEQQLITFQNDRAVRQQALARLLNFERPTEVQAEDPVAKGAAWEMGLEDSILSAYRQRQELSQQLALEGAAKAQEEAAYASLSPQISLTASGQVLDNLLDRVVGFNSGYSAGVQIQWTSFDGGAARAQADQAIADAKSARVRYIDTLNTIRFGVESSYSQLRTASQRIETNTKAVTSADENLRLARLRFQAGVGTQTDVLIADRDLTQARVNRLTAVIDYNRALASLRRALGIL